MNLTEQEIKTLFGYQLCASLMLEYFKYAEPILKRIELEKYPCRERRRKAGKQYDKDLLVYKRWLMGTANVLEKEHENQADEFIDKVSEIINNIKIDVK